jgi:serine/threonine-protein phosphatase 5
MSAPGATEAAVPVSTSAAKAEEFKTRGNQQFALGHFKNAIDDYTEAIQALLADDCNATDAEKKARLPAFYANRAFANLKLELYGDAIADGSKALEIDPSFIKAYYRRGSAYLALAKYKDARTNFKAVLKIKPGDPDATAKAAIADKEIKSEFEPSCGVSLVHSAAV